MGIRIKNLTNTTLHLRSAGTLTAATDKDVAKVPFDGFISNITGGVVGAGTGSTNTIADIHYLGTTIFATATKLTFAATTGVMSSSLVSTLSVTAGAYFTLDIDQVPAAGTPKHLEILITISRNNPGTESTLSDLTEAY